MYHQYNSAARTMYIKRTFRALLFVFVSFAFSSCVSTVEPEFHLPKQTIDDTINANGMSKVILYNNSWFMNAERVSIEIDGKSAGQLVKGEYVILDIPKGKHRFHLEHRDVVIFKSDHTVSLIGDNTYIEIKATIVSNSLKITNKPNDFKKDFEQAYASSSRR